MFSDLYFENIISGAVYRSGLEWQEEREAPRRKLQQVGEPGLKPSVLSGQSEKWWGW